jgi:guanosine-3',5'-bis(diphosphate) 3'-pyrophosphohydrolase
MDPQPVTESESPCPIDFPNGWPQLDLLARALAFAAAKHRHQRRKDRDRSPYINHPIALLRALVHEAQITDPQVLAAALLHDTIEDTDTTAAELVAHFGPDIAALVQEVTDDKRLPQAERKQLQIDHAPTLSDRAKLVKLADKICNLRDVDQSPPERWSIARRQAYFDWAEQVVTALGPMPPTLMEPFHAILQTGRAHLAAPRADRPLRLYWAGPLFSLGERWLNQTLAEELQILGYAVFLPQAECAGLSDPQAIFERCRLGLDQANAVIAVLDGADADSGTCWECGYAFARQLPIVALRTDFRGSGDAGGFNAMLLGTARSVISLTDPAADLPTVRSRLVAAVEALVPLN